MLRTSHIKYQAHARQLESRYVSDKYLNLIGRLGM